MTEWIRRIVRRVCSAGRSGMVKIRKAVASECRSTAFTRMGKSAIIRGREEGPDGGLGVRLYHFETVRQGSHSSRFAEFLAS